MTFKIRIHSHLFSKYPVLQEERFKIALKDLSDPFPDFKGNKKLVKGAKDPTYRFRIGDYRVFYQIDEKEKIVYVIEILTAEQAHKKYGRC
jgi:mRNA interferase RelE/StbE